MTRKLVISAMTLALGLLGTVAFSDAAGAEGCSYRDSTYVDSGVSSATATLYECTDSAGVWYLVEGTLWDDNCSDGRAAYLDLWAEGQGGRTRSLGNCGGSRWYQAGWRGPVYGVKVRTRACNLTCSSEDSDWLYP